jgi:hypothetical protein
LKRHSRDNFYQENPTEHGNRIDMLHSHAAPP